MGGKLYGRLFAEAIAKQDEVIIVEKLIKMLSQYAREIAAPLSNIESVKIIDIGNGNGVNSFRKSITQTMAQVKEPLRELTSLDVTQLLSDLVNRGNIHTIIHYQQDNISYENEEIYDKVESSSLRTEDAKRNLLAETRENDEIALSRIKSYRPISNMAEIGFLFSGTRDPSPLIPF